MKKKTLNEEVNPTWLLDMPDAEPKPPATANLQLLPFDSLSWQNFERLCMRVARETEGDVEKWYLFGTEGQAQGGIDILLTKAGSTKYTVCQAKRHKIFSKSNIESAIEKFKQGEWIGRVDKFVIYTSANLRSTDTISAIEAERENLRLDGIDFVTIDAESLSEILKDIPGIVDDFFGRHWVKVFNGSDAANRLSERLCRSDYVKLHNRLKGFYCSHFSSVDPSVLAAAARVKVSGRPRPLSLSERFVTPDLLEEDNGELFPIHIVDRKRSNEAESHLVSSDDPFNQSSSPFATSRNSENQKTLSGGPSVRRRLSLQDWLMNAEREIILGCAGSGKSTLLRYLALDLLGEASNFPQTKLKWSDKVPIWISFAYWTQLIARDGARESTSLLKVVEEWLKANSEPELVPLVVKALSEGRAILLVDGLDEWSNQTAANTAFSLLMSFIRNRDIPALISSRPHGLKMVEVGPEFRTSQLAPLSANQQLALALPWFHYLESIDDENESSATGVGKRLRAENKANRFIADTQRRSSTAILAATPLLLVGLIALHHAKGSPPTNRIKAYQGLTDLLLTQHPNLRDRDAMRTNVEDESDSSYRERSLLTLAFALQSGSEGTDPRAEAIADTNALAVVEKALSTEFGLEGATLKAKAKKVVEVGEEGLGILVRKSPIEIGFLHRAFQEYLAAKHISSLDVEEQIALIKKYVTDSRWSDVIVFIIQLSHRTSDTGRLLSALDTTVVPPEYEDLRQIILANSIFSDARREYSTTIEMAEKLASLLESSGSTSFAMELLEIIVSGLASGQTREFVERKLYGWFARSHIGTEQLYQQLAMDDHATSSSLSLLWRGLYSERIDAALAAAEALGKLAGGQLEWHEKLSGVIRHSPSPRVLGVAIRALVQGWPTEPSTKKVIEGALKAGELSVYLAGLYGAIKIGLKPDAELDRILHLASIDYFELAGLVNQIIYVGWAGDTNVRDRIIEILKDKNFASGDALLNLLVLSFPEDKIVEGFLVERLADHNNFAFSNILDAIAKSFPNNEKIGNSLLKAYDDEFKSIRQKDLAQIAAIFAGNEAKQLILESIKEHPDRAFWTFSALVKHWGGDDVDAKAIFAEMFAGPIKQRALIAHYFPEFISDKSLCLQAIKDVISAAIDDSSVRGDFALRGLEDIGLDTIPVDLKDFAFRLAAERKNFDAFGIQSAFIRLFPDDPRAVQIAQKLLDQDNALSGFSWHYLKSDDKFADDILRRGAPLDIAVQERVTDILRERADFDAVALDILNRGSSAPDATIASSSILAVAQARVAKVDVDEAYIETLLSYVRYRGEFVGSRRMGGVLGLAIIGRLELFANATEPDGRMATVGSAYELRESFKIRSLISNYWNDLETCLGGRKAVIDRLQLSELWDVESFGENSTQSETVVETVRDILSDAAKHRRLTSNLLRTLESQRPGTEILSDACFEAISYGGADWHTQSIILTAAEILGRNFASDKHLEARAAALLTSRHGLRDGVVAAMCDAWPESEALVAWHEEYKADLKQSDLSPPVAYKLSMAKSTSENAFKNLESAAIRMTGHIWEGCQFWTPNVIKRMRIDPDFHQMVRAALDDEAAPGVKASFINLLVKVNGLTADLDAWCREELAKINIMAVAPVGMNLLTNRPVVLERSLFSILRS